MSTGIFNNVGTNEGMARLAGRLARRSRMIGTAVAAALAFAATATRAADIAVPAPELPATTPESAFFEEGAAAPTTRPTPAELTPAEASVPPTTFVPYERLTPAPAAPLGLDATTPVTPTATPLLADVGGGATAVLPGTAVAQNTPVAAAPTTAPAAAVAPAAPVAAAPTTRPVGIPGLLVDTPNNEGRMSLLVGHSLVVKTKAPYKRLSITAGDVIADNQIDATSILLTAKKAGASQLIVWDDQERSQVIDLVVDVDLGALDAQLKRLFPDAQISSSAANGSIILRGRVPTLQVAEQVTEVVAPYGKVLNFLELAGGQQVMLQVRFAEVSRGANTSLGFNAFATDGTARVGMQMGPGGSPIGALATGAESTINPAVTLFGSGALGSTAFEGFVQAMRNNNLMRVLAEPNLIAISGQEASFLAGGEFPVPVPQPGGGGTAITVEYKQFGVRLNFLPVVLGDGKIRLKVSPEVSDVDNSRSVTISNYTIPALTKRNVTTTIELSEGQTFAVAGLLSNRVTAAKSQIPLLGDIPVLGGLFRSTRYERSETELVVLVTPRLVEAMNPKQVPELPGERWRFPTENDLFLKGDLGGPSADAARAPAAAKAGPANFRGPYGFTPVE